MHKSLSHRHVRFRHTSTASVLCDAATPERAIARHRSVGERIGMPWQPGMVLQGFPRGSVLIWQHWLPWTGRPLSGVAGVKGAGRSTTFTFLICSFTTLPQQLCSRQRWQDVLAYLAWPNSGLSFATL